MKNMLYMSPLQHRAFGCFEDIKKNIDIFAYAQRYVISKQYFDKHCIDFKCDKEQIYS